MTRINIPFCCELLGCKYSKPWACALNNSDSKSIRKMYCPHYDKIEILKRIYKD